jgi:mRNA interferase HigB
MRVIAVKTLKLYAKKKKEAEQSLFTWHREAGKSNWKNHNDLKEQFGNASVISSKRIVFNIHGNKYRLIVDIEYYLQIIFIVWIGTHKEYDDIDAKNVVYVKAN